MRYNKFKFIVTALLLTKFACAAFACASAAPTVSGVTGASDAGNNYWIVQLPATGDVPVVITFAGDAPCPSSTEKCRCPGQADQDPVASGSLVYTISKDGVAQTPGGPSHTFTVTSSTIPAEYKFKVIKIEQAYSACATGWTGGVASGSTINTQESPEVTVLVVKIEISGDHDVIDSLESPDYEVTITPTSITPTAYSWLTGAPGAWPSSAGNSPALTYSAPTAATTTVTDTHWYAANNSPSVEVDNEYCLYNINCQVTIQGVTLKANTPGKLTVVGRITGNTVPPAFINESTITLTEKNGVHYVETRGTFGASAPISTIDPPATCQFANKTIVHEARHVSQFTHDDPWRTLWNAGVMYNTIKYMSASSAALLRSNIHDQITARHNRDAATNNTQSNQCAAEALAHAAEDAATPNFIIWGPSAWKSIYGCP